MIRSMNILALAYMGDSLYETRVRESLLREHPREKVRALHSRAIRFACASAQAQAVRSMIAEGFLTEDEQEIVRRGRNQAVHPPKNADPADYRYATGLEALIGALFFREENRRMEAVIQRAIELLKNE
ncbi:MAG: ribonuclease III domain-containing protein [Peptostreptococcaceae bacterium]|nr:ribonuclease III domain-containing protein [Peptostreptococcaceae bacterium]